MRAEYVTQRIRKEVYLGYRPVSGLWKNLTLQMNAPSLYMNWKLVLLGKNVNAAYGWRVSLQNLIGESNSESVVIVLRGTRVGES